MTTRSSLSSALLVLGAFAFGCGDDDGGDDSPNPTIDGSVDSGNGNGDAGPASDASTPIATNDPVVKADGKMDLLVVITAPSGEPPAPGYVVTALDNDTGASLNITGTTSGTGKVSLSGLPVGKKVTFKVTGQAPSTIDTYSANYPTEIGGGEETVRVVPKASSDIVPTLLSDTASNYTFTPDATKGPISGAVYAWSADKKRQLVGCATIKMDNNAGEPIRYFGPMNLPQAGFAKTSPNNSRYYIGNTNTGKQTIRAYDSTGKEIG
ncbi:MAG TPA: hypothetical protein VFX59_05560, partial [Polyangiales bacterium]|nr:hypothetical protein [Polyangiales bacterium]